MKEIMKIYSYYDDLVTKEDGLLRIGLRYINVIPSLNENDPLQLDFNTGQNTREVTPSCPVSLSLL